MKHEENKEKALFPLLYAAPASYYALLISAETTIDLHEPFVKQSFRSRTRIYGSNGVIAMTIPVQKNSQKLPIHEVQISNIDAWQRIHWRSIQSAYQSSPFFEFYTDLFYPLYQQKIDSLATFNLAFHKTILQCLQLPLDITTTEKPSPFMANDIRALYASKKAIEGANTFPAYQQVFSYSTPFEPDLSILDTIFNLGPETIDYLKKIYAYIRLK